MTTVSNAVLYYAYNTLSTNVPCVRLLPSIFKCMFYYIVCIVSACISYNTPQVVWWVDMHDPEGAKCLEGQVHIYLYTSQNT